MRRTDVQPLPPISPVFWHWFSWYAGRFLRKHFHAVRLLRARRPPDVPPDEPLVVYCNHPSWWDPMVGIYLARRFWPDRSHYWPIEAAMLRKYALFARLGFFGVERDSPRGAAAFLRTATAALAHGRACLWVTAQGEFADVRTRPVRIKPGLARLVRRLDRGVILPLAGEYPFWSERTPEALLRFGRPLRIAEHPTQEYLEAALTEAMDELAQAAVARDAARFITVLGGSAGTTSLYDAWRRAKAAVSGTSFDAAHAPDAGGTERRVIDARAERA